ncbi:MAG: fructose-1-phosphate kinase PfkB-like protein [Bacillariaceae sp.]|jgi:fructose-1-phosphate kinase PfkB-like protein
MISTPIIVVGLNAALQKRFVLPAKQVLMPGNVHRASTINIGVGGKGQDAAIALHCLGLKDAIKLLQFVGTGSTGDIVNKLLLDQLGESAMELTVRSSSEMRTCTSIIASDETTELVEPSGIITSDEVEELFSKKISSCVKNDARSLCIMGSMPPGVGNDTYARIYSKVVRPSSICVIDSLAGIEPLLLKVSKMGNTACPLLLKINASELCKLVGTSKSSSETSGIKEKELINAIDMFLSKYSLSSTTINTFLGLAITDGKHAAYFVSFEKDQNEFRIFKYSVPNLETSQTLYPIGAGDAVAAGVIAGWTSIENTSTSSLPTVPKACLKVLIDFVQSIRKDHSSLTTANAVASFAFGLSCGSASCLQEENSVLDDSDVLRLFQKIRKPDLIHIQAFRR